MKSYFQACFANITLNLSILARFSCSFICSNDFKMKKTSFKSCIWWMVHEKHVYVLECDMYIVNWLVNWSFNICITLHVLAIVYILIYITILIMILGMVHETCDLGTCMHDASGKDIKYMVTSRLTSIWL